MSEKELSEIEKHLKSVDFHYADACPDDIRFVLRDDMPKLCAEIRKAREIIRALQNNLAESERSWKLYDQAEAFLTGGKTEMTTPELQWPEMAIHRIAELEDRLKVCDSACAAMVNRELNLKEIGADFKRQIEVLTVENARIREALKPFAKVADGWKTYRRDYIVLAQWRVEDVIRAGDLIAAKEALQNKG